MKKEVNSLENLQQSQTIFEITGIQIPKILNPDANLSIFVDSDTTATKIAHNLFLRMNPQVVVNKANTPSGYLHKETDCSVTLTLNLPEANIL